MSVNRSHIRYIDDEPRKNIYFVRHGETVFNDGRELFQTSETLLSEKGMRQAEFIGERLKDHPFEVIISSPFKRTLQTAEIINKNLKEELITDDRLIEVTVPSEILGKPFPEVKDIWYELYEDKSDDWKYSDEESFVELSARSRSFLEDIIDRPEKDVLVVSHSRLIKLMMGVILFGSQATRKECFGLMRQLVLDNTGITLFHYFPENKVWRLRTWNDLSHLD